MQGGKLEHVNLARVLERSLEVERSIESISVPAEDIFDLIDEDTVRDHQQAIAPSAKEPFPGHLEARQGVKAGISWKTNYRERFGLDLLDVGLFEELGRLMAASGKVPLALRRLVDSAIALGDD